MDSRPRRRSEAGPIIFGLILLVVGAWYLLQRTFGLDLPELDADRLWPIVVILIGAAVLWNAFSRQREA